MTYTIEKQRPPKKEQNEKKEERKNYDPLFAIFGNYEKKIENLKIK